MVLFFVEDRKRWETQLLLGRPETPSTSIHISGRWSETPDNLKAVFIRCTSLYIFWLEIGKVDKVIAKKARQYKASLYSFHVFSYFWLEIGNAHRLNCRQEGETTKGEFLLVPILFIFRKRCQTQLSPERPDNVRRVLTSSNSMIFPSWRS